MIGDVIIWFKKFLKQLVCYHNYKHVPSMLYGGKKGHYKCCKCERLKFLD